MTDAYIHGFSAEERERLVRQARVLAPQVFGGMAFEDVRTVLEIGCAVGAELQILHEHWPHLLLTGVDRSRAQIAAAEDLLRTHVERGSVRLVQADARHLPLPDRTFDRVITIWTLEHVHDIEGALAEALRVLRDEGTLVLTEVDNGTFSFSPGCEGIAEWWRQFNRCQEEAGGNPRIGRTLAATALDCGARDVREDVVRIINSRDQPRQRAVLLDYLEELLLSGTESMTRGGYANPDLVKAMQSDFARARADATVQFQYHAVRVTCRRGKPPR